MTAVTKQTLYDYFCSGGSATNSISTIESELEDLIDTFFGTLTDYSDDSTIVGWSAYTTQKISYLLKGDLLFVQYNLAGTSNSIFSSFTLPKASGVGFTSTAVGLAGDNGGTKVAGLISVVNESSICTLGKDVAGSSWTNSGTKTVQGEIFLRVTL